MEEILTYWLGKGIVPQDGCQCITLLIPVNNHDNGQRHRLCDSSIHINTRTRYHASKLVHKSNLI